MHYAVSKGAADAESYAQFDSMLKRSPSTGHHLGHQFGIADGFAGILPVVFPGKCLVDNF